MHNCVGEMRGKNKKKGIVKTWNFYRFANEKCTFFRHSIIFGVLMFTKVMLFLRIGVPFYCFFVSVYMISLNLQLFLDFFTNFAAKNKNNAIIFE